MHLKLFNTEYMHSWNLDRYDLKIESGRKIKIDLKQLNPRLLMLFVNIVQTVDSKFGNNKIAIYL